MRALVCDVGGTNTRLGIVESDVLVAGSLASSRNVDFASFAEVLENYLDRCGKSSVDVACIALAAPTGADGATLTNYEWHISRGAVEAVTGARAVHFLNDFEALGNALSRIEALETVTLHAGIPGGKPATRLVLGAGTGFNAAALVFDQATGRPLAIAAECGHMSLPVEGPDEHDLQGFLSRGRGRASVERALSGRGLAEIYAWCCERAGVVPRLGSAPDILTRAVDRSDDQAIEAAFLFGRLLGRVAGDLSLAFLPFGGVYLTGGVTRALRPLIEQDPSILASFRAKGRMSGFMDQFPISLLIDDRVALSGCAAWLSSRQPDRPA